MLFLVAAEGATLSSPVSKRFGHASFHLMVDADQRTILEALEQNHDLPGHGVGRFSKWKIDGVITGNVGPGAFEDLRARNLDVFVVRGATVFEAIQQVVKGKVHTAEGPTLKRSIHEHGGGHHHHGNDHP